MNEVNQYASFQFTVLHQILNSLFWLLVEEIESDSVFSFSDDFRNLEVVGCAVLLQLRVIRFIVIVNILSFPQRRRATFGEIVIVELFNRNAALTAR